MATRSIPEIEEPLPSPAETSPGVVIGEDAPNTENTGYSSFISAVGYVLAVSYPVLALSTGVRALYQLFFKEGVTDYVPPLLSLLAASLYLIATIGFAYRRVWTWWLSVVALSLEAFFTILVGTLSFTHPDLIGHTVWTHFGQDYGWFPLIQPLLGLAWLLWPATRRMYAIKTRAAAAQVLSASQNG